jgi:hypothetical protein
MGAGIPFFGKRKTLLRSFINIEIIHACTYYLDTYSYEFFNTKYDCMYPTQKIKKWKFVFL